MTIVDIQMKRVREQMATHEVAIELTDEAKELLVEKGYDPAMGARPPRLRLRCREEAMAALPARPFSKRAIQRVIEDPLADFVLGRSLEPGSTILVSRKPDSDEVEMTFIPGEVTPEKVTVPPEEPMASGEDEPEPVEE
jgi:ATP-dependent Clp protease ATP-binding subunit ClpC